MAKSAPVYVYNTYNGSVSRFSQNYYTENIFNIDHIKKCYNKFWKIIWHWRLEYGCWKFSSASLNTEYCQAKLIQTLVRASQGVNWSWSQCIKSYYAQMSSGKGLPSHFWNRNNVSTAKEKNNWTVAQWSKVLFSDKSKFCISFGNQSPRVWRKSGEEQNTYCLKSSVTFPQSVMIWAVMSSAGVGPLCFLKSTVNAAIYQEILEHFMLPSADKLYGDADFIF